MLSSYSAPCLAAQAGGTSEGSKPVPSTGTPAWLQEMYQRNLKSGSREAAEPSLALWHRVKAQRGRGTGSGSGSGGAGAGQEQQPPVDVNGSGDTSGSGQGRSSSDGSDEEDGVGRSQDGATGAPGGGLDGTDVGHVRGGSCSSAHLQSEAQGVQATWPGAQPSIATAAPTATSAPISPHSRPSECEPKPAISAAGVGSAPAHSSAARAPAPQATAPAAMHSTGAGSTVTDLAPGGTAGESSLGSSQSVMQAVKRVMASRGQVPCAVAPTASQQSQPPIPSGPASGTQPLVGNNGTGLRLATAMGAHQGSVLPGPSSPPYTSLKHTIRLPAGCGQEEAGAAVGAADCDDDLAWDLYGSATATSAAVPYL